MWSEPFQSFWISQFQTFASFHSDYSYLPIFKKLTSIQKLLTRFKKDLKLIGKEITFWVFANIACSLLTPSLGFIFDSFSWFIFVKMKKKTRIVRKNSNNAKRITNNFPSSGMIFLLRMSNRSDYLKRWVSRFVSKWSSHNFDKSWKSF